MAATELTQLINDIVKANHAALAMARELLDIEKTRGASRRLKAREQAIINAIGRGGSVKGLLIARALGVEFTHSFQDCLSKMKREGILANAGKGDGYSVSLEWEASVQDDPDGDAPP